MKALWKWVAFAVGLLSAVLVLFAAEASAQVARPAEASLNTFASSTRHVLQS